MKTLLTTILVLTALSYLSYNNIDSVSNNVKFLQDVRQTLSGLDSCIDGCYQCQDDDQKCQTAQTYYNNVQHSNYQCIDYQEFHDSNSGEEAVPLSWYICQGKAKPYDMGRFVNRYDCILKCGN